MKKINKGLIITGAVILIGIVIIGIMLICKKNNPGSQEHQFEQKMKEMANSFYQGFYYNAVGSNDTERKEFVKKYETIGLKVNLDNLSRYQGGNSEEILKTFVNDKTGKECDKEETKAIIYPQEPYGITDYKLEIKLECGF